MKTEIINALLLIAAFGGSLQLLFLYLVRPIMIQQLQYSIFSLRDELRIIAMDVMEASEYGKAYRILEGHLNVAENLVGSIDIDDLILLKPNDADVKRATEAFSIIDESSAEIRAIHGKAMRCIVASLIVNSPILFFGLPVLEVVSLFVHRAQKVMEDYNARAWAVSGDASRFVAA